MSTPLLPRRPLASIESVAELEEYATRPRLLHPPLHPPLCCIVHMVVGVVTWDVVTCRRRYITLLPNELRELREEIDVMMAEQQVLFEFEYLMPDDEFQSFWRTLAWPKRIEEGCEQATIASIA